jgi:uncharacterized membrane protein YeiB
VDGVAALFPPRAHDTVPIGRVEDDHPTDQLPTTEPRVPGLPPRRLAGVDVARGLAVLGMYASHIGPDPTQGGIGVLFRPFEGRSAALFAVLAGVSISLMSGGRKPKTGTARVRVSLRLGTRAPLILALGLWLTNLETGYLVILAYYGICFLLAIPCVGLRPRTLAIASLLTATVVPFVSYFVRAKIAPRDLLYVLPDVTFDNFRSIADLPDSLTVLALTGTFPALGLMAYLFAGMAIGRLDLESGIVCRRLVVGGLSLAGVAYGASLLATRVFGGMDAILRTLAPAAAQAGKSPEQLFTEHVNNIHGTPPTTTLAWELVASAHSYTPFDLLGCIGLCAAVVGGGQLAVRRFNRLLRPVEDLGAVILSAYALHFVAIYLIWNPDDQGIFSSWHFLWFSLAALAAAVFWKRFIGRGPLEWALHLLSTWPDRVLPDHTKITFQRS